MIMLIPLTIFVAGSIYLSVRVIKNSEKNRCN